VSYIPGYSTGGVPKPVLIFGGGYDVLKDDTATVAGADTEGRGIFIVDAITGALVWSVTPAANSATNLQSTGTSGLRFSIPASLTVLDSDGDELTDRIYAADTGGNVWRVDMPGSARPTSSQTAWRITRIAALNTSSTDSHAGDRRFFNAVDVVRTRDSYATFDALLIGSGDRENPNATNNRDRLYMLRDRQTSPYTTAAPNSSACSAGSADFRCSLPITDSGLYDASANLLQVGTAAQKAAA
jgi:type IV pilus assembly protein PilY1